MEDDDRFKKFATDPKFRSVSRKDKKVKIDKRFQSMFTDKRFSNKVGVDKRGRPESFSSKETYQKFYRVNEKKKKSKAADNDDEDETSSGSSSSDDDEEHVAAKPSANLEGQPDYARGEGQLESSSSEEESDDEENGGQEEETAFDKWGELDHDAERTDDISRRLAVCNLDWDRVGAQDIFLALSSFCPKNQRVESVRVYLSEFGKSRLEDEERLGPQELRHQPAKDKGSDSEDEDRLISGDVVDDQDAIDKEAMERVRLYQVRKLKYYYAVAAFTTEEAANAVYTECDGQEYELSATRFDLRFIPDDMEFDDADMKDECLALPDPDKYKPKVFFNKALMQGKAELTWDEDDPDRQAAMRRAFDNPEGLDDDDLKAFIATSSGDEDTEAVNTFESVVAGAPSSDEDDESRVEKYKALLLGGGDSNAQKKSGNSSKRQEEGNMEMTFADKSKLGEEEKQKEFEGMTPWEQYLHKRKEKKKAKRLMKTQNKTGDELEEEDGVNSDYNDDDVPDDLRNDPFFRHSDDDDEKQRQQKAAAKKKQKKKKEKNDDERSGDLPLLVMDADDDEKKHFDYKDIVKADTMSKKKLKKLKKKQDKGEEEASKEDDFQVNLQDDRFGAVFESADFNVDPSHPNFKKTKSMQAIVDEKQKRITSGKRKAVNANNGGEEITKKVKPNANSSSESSKDSLQKLMHSVKAKSHHMHSAKSNKKLRSRK